MRIDTDFNIRRASKRNFAQILSAQEDVRQAVSSFEELTPKYNQAVSAATEYQSILTDDFNSYVTVKEAFESKLAKSFKAYEDAAAAEIKLQNTYATAQGDLEFLKKNVDAQREVAISLQNTYATERGTLDFMRKNLDPRAATANDLYKIYTSEQLGSPASDSALRTYNAYVQDEYMPKKAEYDEYALVVESSKRTYDNFVENEYNPRLDKYNNYLTGTFDDAAKAFSAGSEKAKAAVASYEALANDSTDAVSASKARSVYDASAERYKELQTGYETLVPQLNEYTLAGERAGVQVLEGKMLQSGLDRSLSIDTETRKRGVRQGYQQSILSRGFKRPGSFR